jgi:predicted MarR family transcription regulator
MTREIYALNAAIAERRTAVKTDEVNVAEIFSKQETVAPSVPSMEPVSQGPFHAVVRESEPAIRQSANDSAIRQKTILERIRQSGNCRLKDIQEVLPDTSERTIRYDIQALLEQGVVERIGNAGPSVFYRATPTVHAADVTTGVETYVPEIR